MDYSYSSINTSHHNTPQHIIQYYDNSSKYNDNSAYGNFLYNIGETYSNNTTQSYKLSNTENKLTFLKSDTIGSVTIEYGTLTWDSKESPPIEKIVTLVQNNNIKIVKIKNLSDIEHPALINDIELRMLVKSSVLKLELQNVDLNDASAIVIAESLQHSSLVALNLKSNNI